MTLVIARLPLWQLAAAAIGASLLLIVAMARWAQPSDEHAYWLAARRLLEGQPLYDPTATFPGRLRRALAASMLRVPRAPGAVKVSPGLGIAYDAPAWSVVGSRDRYRRPGSSPRPEHRPVA